MGNTVETPKYTVTIEVDSDVESPMDEDCQWTLYSFNSRHSNYRDPEALGLGPLNEFGEVAIPSLGLRRRLHVGTAFIVSYYEHGDCKWGLQGGVPSCPWDSRRVAGLLVWERPIKELGASALKDAHERYLMRRKYAEGFLESYTAWSNGDCYWYSIEDAAGETVDSCGGFIGVEHLIAGLIDAGYGDALEFSDEQLYVSGKYTKALTTKKGA